MSKAIDIRQRNKTCTTLLTFGLNVVVFFHLVIKDRLFLIIGAKNWINILAPGSSRYNMGFQEGGESNWQTVRRPLPGPDGVWIAMGFMHGLLQIF